MSGRRINNGSLAKRRRTGEAAFVEEERKLHGILDRLEKDTSGTLPCQLKPGTDVNALKRNISEDLRRKHGLLLSDESSTDVGEARANDEPNPSPRIATKGRRRRGQSSVKAIRYLNSNSAGSNDTSESSSSCDGGSDTSSSSSSSSDDGSDEEQEEMHGRVSASFQTEQVSCKSATPARDLNSTAESSSSESDSFSSSPDSSDHEDTDDVPLSNQRDSPSTERAFIDLTGSTSASDGGSESIDEESCHHAPVVRRADKFDEESSNADEIAETTCWLGPDLGGAENERVGEDMTQESSATNHTGRTTNEHDDDEDFQSEDEDGWDLDEDDEVHLVTQLRLPRVMPRNKNMKDSEEYSEDEPEQAQAEEGIDRTTIHGLTYEVNKTYCFTPDDNTYMYCLLNMHRNSEGEVHCECAQVLRLSDTFLSSVESQQPNFVRFVGTERMRLDARFGDEVNEVDGIPDVNYEVNVGRGLHFAFYPKEMPGASMPPATGKPRVLDLFSGAGGMSLGFHAAGFESAMAVEKNPFAVQALSSFVRSIFPQDIRVFLRACRSESYRSQVGKVHHVHASPPCQGFSSANRNGGRNDTENKDLSMTLLEVVALFSPATVTYEMVTGILQNKHRPYLEKLIHGLLEQGYKVRCCILNAGDFGDPQSRRRLFLFAAASGIELPRVPRATHGESRHLLPRQTVRDAIGNLPHPASPDTEEMLYEGSTLFNTWRPETTTSPDDPESVVLDPTKPACTIRVAGKPPFHYQQEKLPGQEPKYRCLSLREMAMLQSFPMDMKFWGNKLEQRRQVGNAVPVKLATAVARSVRDVLTFVK